MENEETVSKKTPKKKRRVGRIIFRILVVLLIILALPFVALRIPAVQTYVAGIITKSLSETLGSEVKIRSVNLAFFNKISLEGLYVQDPLNDTLIYVENIKADIKKLPLFGNSLTIGSLKLSDGVFRLYSDSIGANIARILGNIPKKEDTDTTKSKSKFVLKTESIELENFRYRMHLYNAVEIEDQPSGIIYKNMSADSINLKADGITIIGDTLFFRAENLSLRERSGLNLKRFSAEKGYICFGKQIMLQDVEIIDDFSDLKLNEISLTYNGGEEFKDFLNKVVIKCDIKAHSELAFRTLGFFAPVLEHIPLKVKLKGSIYGPVANLRSDSISIKSMKDTEIEGRFNINGLPDIMSAIIFADLKKMVTTKEDIFEALGGITGQNHNDLNNILGVSKIHFTGSFTGLINDFVANGNLNGAFGSLKLDLLFNTNKLSLNKFKGNLIAKNLNLGMLLKNPNIGKSNFNLMIDSKFNGKYNDSYGEGTISLLEFNNYRYGDIKLNGRLKNKEFDGEIAVLDPNIDFNFSGKVNLEGTGDSIPTFNFSADIRNADLAKLNINRSDSVSIIKAQIKADFKATSILDYVGDLVVSNAEYTDNSGKMKIGNVTLSSLSKENGDLRLRSNFLDADYIGTRHLGYFVSDIKNIIHKHVPALLNQSGDITNKSEGYKIRVEVKEIDYLSRIFAPGLFLSNGSELKVEIDTSNNVLLNLNSETLSYGGLIAKNINVNGKAYDSTFSVNVVTDSVSMSGLVLKNFTIENNIAHNSIKTSMFYNNNFADKSEIHFTTDILQNNKNKNSLKVNIEPSEVFAHDEKWKINPSSILVDTGIISVENFKLQNGNQILGVSGIVSSSGNDTIKLNLENYKVSGLNFITKQNGYDLGGTAFGYAEITSLFDVPIFLMNFQINDFIINNDSIGNITFVSLWSDEIKRLDVITRIYDNNGVSTLINGFIEPENKYLQADAKINKLKLHVINPILTGILSDVTGTAEGNLSIKGKFSEPELSGKLKLNNAQMTVDYLGTRYDVDADIDISKSLFIIDNADVKDAEGHLGKLNMKLTHKNFNDIKFDASATVNNFLSLNTKEKDNPLFYGRAYATGKINLKGSPNEFNFNITARGEDKSILHIPLPNTAEAKEMEFLTFKRNDSIPHKEIIETKESKAVINLGMDLSVSPEAEIQILIDPLVGDIIKARGQGNLKMDVRPSINLFTIVGDYTIESGDYNFTVPNFSFITRKFIIEKGSRIKFDGDVSNAVLDVSATYKANVSITPLIPEDSSRRYIANCKILISGQMTRPQLKFEIDLPDLDPEKKARILTFLNSDEKITKQFLSILALGTFTSDQNLATSVNVFQNTSQILSSQIGSLISMFNLPIPLDVNVDYTGTSSEFEFRTVLWDRVTIAGGGTNNTRSNRNFVGDFEAELRLDKKGKATFKAFSKSRDYFSDDMENNRQGIGVAYQGQFDKFGDLFRRKKKKKQPK